MLYIQFKYCWGWGLAVWPLGYIVTNDHVLGEVRPGGITVSLTDDRRLPAEIIGRDPPTDFRGNRLSDTTCLTQAFFKSGEYFSRLW